MKRRVVVTGLGVVSPLGLDTPSTWDGLVRGKSGIGPITKFDASAFSSRIAGEVRGFEPGRFLDKKDVKKMDTFIHFAVAASKEALADAGLAIDDGNAERVGVYIGSGIGGLSLLEDQHGELMNKGPRRISPFFIPGMIINLAAGQVSILTGAKGPNLAVATACATGNHAIGEAMRLIREDYADAMIAGGTDAGVTPLAVGGFCAMKALSTRNDAPEKASRPFDADRDGFVIGEGAGILVLEERERAMARGAKIYAELAGYGPSGDAYHISAPSENGEGAARAMKVALKDAACDPREVDYINAHGTSTPVGDRIETQAVKTVFGPHARELVFASTKSMTGHLLGAAGGLESAATVLAIHHGVVPPTINRDTPDPDCDLDCAPSGARKMPVRAALNNS
ncbi:MAG TPA: beta-ketoacyl-ACP synthase II, partial [Candidatus Polarisedimenticolaceae bacterium]|nr:beta-ketoacyl-ACP synthase II [Candidatus Polarisedimenticolaceae bacterium]